MLYQRLRFAVFCLFRRRRAEIELEEEIGAHLAMAEQERRDRGETPREAQQNARRELGNELLIKETTRDMWEWTYLERLAHDRDTYCAKSGAARCSQLRPSSHWPWGSEARPQCSRS
jgi:hypothetical protein